MKRLVIALTVLAALWMVGGAVKCCTERNKDGKCVRWDVCAVK